MCQCATEIDPHENTTEKSQYKKMKKLSLKTSVYAELEKEYGIWLKQLGYSEQTVYMFPSQVREFLHWLENKGKLKVSQIDQNLATDFMNYFKTRPNERRGGGLSKSHINKQSLALNLLFKYLGLTGQLKIKIELAYSGKDEVKPKLILTQSQVDLLYNSCSRDPLGDRDRAMLSIYYGCGLRRSEGLTLEIGDILFERNLLHVRKTKNRWERYVPMVLGVRQDLERYIYGARKLLAGKDSPGNLFLTNRGQAVSGLTMLRRLKDLLKENDLPAEIGLHSLRHSIATHLVEGGMELEQVSYFLGHRQLDSTQGYTHLKTKAWKKN